MYRPEFAEAARTFTLQEAVDLAMEAHKDQKDKGTGAPYISHCLRVMSALEPYGKDYQTVGVLHDTLEDTWVTADYLREQGMDEELVEDILAMTKRPGEPYGDLVRRAKGRPRSKLGKLADNLDNSDENRLRNFEPARAQQFRDKYGLAREILLEDDEWLQAQLPVLQASITAQNQVVE